MQFKTIFALIFATMAAASPAGVVVPDGCTNGEVPGGAMRRVPVPIDARVRPDILYP